MFISLILEGEDSPNYKTILKEHVLYLSITNHDAFLQSMVYWNLNQYQQALNCLLNDIHSDEFAVRSLLPLFIPRFQKCRFLIPSPIFTLPVLATTSQFLHPIPQPPSSTPSSNSWVPAPCTIKRFRHYFYVLRSPIKTNTALPWPTSAYCKVTLNEEPVSITNH